MEKNAAIFRGGKGRTMIWKNAEIFNVEELILQEDGFYATRRLKDPEQSYEKDNIFVQNKTSHGVEVRFRLIGGAARLVCRTAAGAAGKCCVFIGRTLLGEYTVTDRPTEIVRVGNGYMGAAAKANTRTPAGHPEGYIEAFANIYRNFARTVMAKRDGREPEASWLDFPGVDDGIRGMQFIETVVRSGYEQNVKWIKWIE